MGRLHCRNCETPKWKVLEVLEVVLADQSGTADKASLDGYHCGNTIVWS